MIYTGMALLYGLLTSFVLVSASRSRRLSRPLSQSVVLIGWAMAAASLTLGVALLAIVALALLGGPR